MHHQLLHEVRGQLTEAVAQLQDFLHLHRLLGSDLRPCTKDERE